MCRATPEYNLERSFPEVAAEWHPTWNGCLRPTDVTCGSDREVWWLGACGHPWKTSVLHRVGYGNDLATRFPGVAVQWHPTRNGDLGPHRVTPSSDRKVWWLGECGHAWDAQVKDRTRGYGCPYCSGHRVGYGNDLATRRHLVAEWHPPLATATSPQVTSPRSPRSGAGGAASVATSGKRGLPRAPRQEPGCSRCETVAVSRREITLFAELAAVLGPAVTQGASIAARNRRSLHFDIGTRAGL